MKRGIQKMEEKETRFDRISNVYIDIQNLAEEMDLDIVRFVNEKAPAGQAGG